MLVDAMVTELGLVPESERWSSSHVCEISRPVTSPNLRVILGMPHTSPTRAENAGTPHGNANPPWLDSRTSLMHRLSLPGCYYSKSM